MRLLVVVRLLKARYTPRQVSVLKQMAGRFRVQRPLLHTSFLSDFGCFATCRLPTGANFTIRAPARSVMRTRDDL